MFYYINASVFRQAYPLSQCLFHIFTQTILNLNTLTARLIIHHEYSLFDVHWRNFKCERGCLCPHFNSRKLVEFRHDGMFRDKSAEMALHKIQFTDYEILD